MSELVTGEFEVAASTYMGIERAKQIKERAAKNVITGPQKKIIWTMVRKSGMDEEGFRDWLQRQFGKRSTRELTEAQAAEAIRALKTFTGQEYTRRTRTWGITARQLGKVKGLAHDLGWNEPERLNGLIKKMFDGKFRPEQLNKTEASKLIVALERMIEDDRVYA